MFTTYFLGSAYDAAIQAQSSVERNAPDYHQWVLDVGRWLYTTDHIQCQGRRPSPSWNRSSRRTFCLAASGSDRSGRRTRRWKWCAPRSMLGRSGCSTPTSRTASAACRFDAIVSQVERRVSDRKMLKLIRAWLRVGVLEGGVVTGQVAGAPQGSPVSPLLAKIVLHVLDQAWSEMGQGLGTLVRYCDDCVTRTQGGIGVEDRTRQVVLCQRWRWALRVLSATRSERGAA